MLPGNINPKQMKAMMKKMGMEVAPIENVSSVSYTHLTLPTNREV